MLILGNMDYLRDCLTKKGMPNPVRENFFKEGET